MAQTYFYNIDHNVKDDFHVYGCKDCLKLREEIAERGTHFSAEETVRIAQTWKPYGRIVALDQEGATVRLTNGETFEITHHRISVPPTPNHEWLGGVMKHVKSNWDGAFYTGGGRMTENGFVPPDKPTKEVIELRLMYHAYAHVFSVEYEDRDESFHPLSQRQLTKLPKLIAEIEKAHGVKSPPWPPQSRGHDQEQQTDGRQDRRSEADHARRSQYDQFLSAVLSGKTTEVKQLIASGVDIHGKGEGLENRALEFAAENGHAEIVKVLLQAGADVHHGGNTALITAAEKGHADAVKALIEGGAFVDARDGEALREAASKGHTDTVKVLLKAGADVHVGAGGSRPPWEEKSTAFDHSDSPLRWAVENNHTETAKALLDAGANVHINDEYLLRRAVHAGRPRMVQLLLDAGADAAAGQGELLRDAKWHATKEHLEVADILKKHLQAGRSDRGPKAGPKPLQPGLGG